MSFVDKFVAGLKPSFETIVAAGAAAITGAAVYLMPVDLLQNAVIASGLPDFLPPLDPPLGGKARIGLALVAAGLAFGLVALLVRLVVGKQTVRPFAVKKAAKPIKARPAPVADLPEAPKVRRRDRHPDAPVRAPLLIGREIGLPEEDKLPGFTATRTVEPSPAPWVEEAVEPVPPVAVEAWPEPAFAEPEIAEREHEPEHEAAAEPIAEYRPEPEWKPADAVATHPAWLDAGPAAAQAGGEPTLAELLERLERAMAPRVPVTPAAPAPDAPATPVSDDPLRSALESLKRFAPSRN